MKKIHPCKYDKYKSKQIECPADRSLYFINTMLNELEGKNYSQLTADKDGFGNTLQQEIQRLYPGSEVYWSLGSEKEDAKKQGTSDRGCESEWLGNLLKNLNNNYHSHLFLHNLVKYTYIGQANLFTISLDSNGIKLDTYKRDDLSNNKKFKDFSSTFKLSREESSPAEFYESIKRKWNGIYLESHREEVVLEIKNHLNKWRQSHSFVLREEEKKEKDNDGNLIPTKAFTETIESFNDAIMHFALISLYLCHAKSKYVTYFLSPTIQKKFHSSMVVYWGGGRMPERSFLYLLSMLLGLNAAPVLQSLSQSELKQMAFLNAGHIMKNRTIAPGDALSDIYDLDSQQLKTNDLAVIEKNVYYALRDTKSLFNLYQASRLWGFSSLEDLVKFYNEHSDTPEQRMEKKKQFLSYEGFVDLKNVIEQVGQFCTYGSHYNNRTRQQTLYTLQITFNSQTLSIHPALNDPLDGRCNLNHDVLSAIFYEFLLNAFKHAYLPKTKNGETAIKKLTIGTSVIFEKPVIILSNDCGIDERQHSSDFIEATEIPEKGIGMINSILTSIKCGKIWQKRFFKNSELDTYTVAVHLDGLHAK